MRIMLVDDHPLIREALARLLSIERDLDVVGATGDAEEAVRMAGELRPDVVVMDVDLHGADLKGVDGISATRALLAEHPAVKVVMLSASCSPSLIRDSAEAGAWGYLLKGDPADQIPEGIRAAARGEHPMGVEVARLCRTMGEAGGTGPDALGVEAPSLWPRATPFQRQTS
ncbi:LuxR family transcriptional regulator [Knoellia sinensis KCTC 19936]|uniref:LuxR family transcriptional regulator n=1 Tax=Knoellia sinensis KCTC 19936 TaxID=1385520 RepID=A0A0A0J2B9_9MICO|nr:LuxR family transcriptional regulator [Knoellia sinensis KCTC 19936]